MAEQPHDDRPDAAADGPDEYADDLDETVFLGSDGRLSILAGMAEFEFSFTHCDVPFRAHVRPCGDGVRMRIAGDVAPLPYTAESQDARRALLDILRKCRDFDWGECGVTAEQRIVVHGEVEVANPVTPVRVVSAVATFILSATPCMKLVAENLPWDYYANAAAG